MSTLKHHWFGQLDTGQLTTSDVIWKCELPLAGSAVEVSLWADAGVALDAEMLDDFATRLGSLAALDATAREGLRQYLQEDRAYIKDHAENVEDSEIWAALIGNGRANEVSVDAFVAAMSLQGINVWLEFEEAPLALDYMIDPETSNEILVVQLNRDGQIVAIVWES